MLAPFCGFPGPSPLAGRCRSLPGPVLGRPRRPAEDRAGTIYLSSGAEVSCLAGGQQAARCCAQAALAAALGSTLISDRTGQLVFQLCHKELRVRNSRILTRWSGGRAAQAVALPLSARARYGLPLRPPCSSLRFVSQSPRTQPPCASSTCLKGALALGRATGGGHKQAGPV